MPSQDPSQKPSREQSQCDNRTAISFEVFPPKGDLPVEDATKLASELTKLNPDFISVTYSAAGSGNSESTAEVAKAIQDNFDVPVVAHLTCMGKSRQMIDEIIDVYKDYGIKSVLALRGDPMPDAPESDFSYAKDLIPILKESGFKVGAAAYPEGHVSCFDLDDDIRFMKEKQDAGADFFISQLFFNNGEYFKFLDRAEEAGISAPIHAGIMPFTSQGQVKRMVYTCGATLPAYIVKLLAKCGDDDAAFMQAGIEYATQQIIELIDEGVDAIHIYTMNRPDITEKILADVREACPSARAVDRTSPSWHRSVRDRAVG